MATCRNHKDIEAAHVCSVCGGYFCGECVSERYYPKPSLICHHCSGEKAYEPPEETTADTDESDDGAGKASSAVLIASIKDRIVVSTEWLVLLVCLVIIIAPRLTDDERETETLVLESEQPEDLAVYCLGRLDDMEYREVSTTLVDVKEACHYPIEVTEVDGLIVVRSPDEETYGFTEIEVETNPVFLTILE